MKPKAPAILMLVGGLIFLFGDRLPEASSLFSLNSRPINASGFRAMIVYDDEKLSSMPEPEKAVIFSATIRKFLNDNCEKSGASPDYRVVSTKADMSTDSTHWQEAFSRPMKSTPWIILNGKTSGGYEGALPKSVDATLALLKKYAGVKR